MAYDTLAKLHGVPVADLEALHVQIEEALTETGQFHSGAVKIKKVATRYHLTFGRRVFREVPTMDEAAHSGVYYLQRRCTGCGTRGCAHDLNGGYPTLIEILDEAAEFGGTWAAEGRPPR